jgi:hypothetical protein
MYFFVQTGCVVAVHEVAHFFVLQFFLIVDGCGFLEYVVEGMVVFHDSVVLAQTRGLVLGAQRDFKVVQNFGIVILFGAQIVAACLPEFFFFELKFQLGFLTLAQPLLDQGMPLGDFHTQIFDLGIQNVDLIGNIVDCMLHVVNVILGIFTPILYCVSLAFLAAHVHPRF